MGSHNLVGYSYRIPSPESAHGALQGMSMIPAELEFGYRKPFNSTLSIDPIYL